MGLEIYADVVFLINFLMDLFILWVTAKLAGKKLKLFRLCMAAFVMALLYCLLTFVPSMRVYYGFLSSLIIIMTGVVLAYKPPGIREFFKLIFLSYISAFSIGGMGMALYYFTDIPAAVSNTAGFIVRNFSFKVLLASVCTFYILIKCAGKYLERTLVRKQTFLPVKIFFDEIDISINALVDTGNTLHEPVSNYPVIIAEFGSIKEFLPEGVRLVFYENRENNLSQLLSGVADGSFYNRFRMIPYASLGRQNGMLLGFRPDKVEIKDTKKTITLQEVVIGIYNFKLSADGSYQGLINPEVIQT